jgi:hypothetical protein
MLLLLFWPIVLPWTITPYCTLGHRSMCNTVQYIQDKNLFFCRGMPRSQSGKTQKVDPAAEGQAVQYIINNNAKLRMAAFNFGISKTKLSCYLLQFQEQEPPPY